MLIIFFSILKALVKLIALDALLESSIAMFVRELKRLNGSWKFLSNSKFLKFMLNLIWNLKLMNEFL